MIRQYHLLNYFSFLNSMQYIVKNEKIYQLNLYYIILFHQIKENIFKNSE